MGYLQMDTAAVHKNPPTAYMLVNGALCVNLLSKDLRAAFLAKRGSKNASYLLRFL